MARQQQILTGRNVKRRGQGLTEDDLAQVEPVSGGGVTTGKTVTLGAGSSEQPQQETSSEQQSARKS